jgi:hypothetical protein
MGKGSGGGGGGGTQQTSSTFSPWYPWPLQEYWKRAEMLSQPQGGTYPGPSQQVAGFSPAETLGMNLNLSAIPGMSSLYGAGAGALGMSLGGGYFNPNANPYMSGLSNVPGNPYTSGLISNNPYISGGASNPYLQQYANAATQQLGDVYAASTAPSEMSNAMLSGAFGGSADAEARALNQYSFGQNVGNTLANIYEPAWAQQAQLYTSSLADQAQLAQQQAQLQAQQQQYQAGLYGTQFGQAMQNQLGALGILPQTMQAGTLPGETALGVGGLQQQQAQQQLNAAYQNQYNQAFWPYQLVNWLGQAATGVNQGFGQGVQNTSFGGGGPGFGQELLGGGLGLAGLGGLLFAGGPNSAWSGLGSAGSGLFNWLGGIGL